MPISQIPKYEFNDLCRYCQGAGQTIDGWIALEAGDGVTHGTMANGAKMLWRDQKEFGSQDEDGKKGKKEKKIKTEPKPEVQTDLKVIQKMQKKTAGLRLEIQKVENEIKNKVWSKI